MASGKDRERAKEEFLAEAQELIEGLSRGLLELDTGLKQGQRSAETVNDLFRGVHTLKGLSGMFGFERLGRMSHVLEDLLEDLRLGRVDLTQQVLDVLFEGVDSFQRLLGDAAEQASVDVEAFTTRVHGLARAKAKSHNVLEDFELDASMLGVLTEYEEHRLRTNLEQGMTVYRLRVRLALDVIDTALDQLKERVKNLAEIITYLPSMDGGGGDDIEIEMLLASKRSESEVRQALGRPDAALSAVEKRRGAAKPVPPMPAAPAAPAESAPPAAPAAPVSSTAKSEEPAAGPLSTPGPKPEAAAQSNAKRPAAEGGDLSLRSITSVVRVDIRKLDHLMNVVGELGTVRAAVSRLVERLRAGAAPALTSEAHRIHRAFQRHLAEVQESVLDIRMVPLSQLFDKVAVVVRQVAREQKKEVRLSIVGAETEVDKLIAEELADPMMHIVRNAIDHGIEPPEARTKLGKPSSGTLTVVAHQKGNHVVIELADDGRGIDSNVIREAAVRKGVLSEQAASDLTREELLNVIFMPGFSTAREITGISGRGVGMDVVKTNITRLGGAVDIESEPGRGAKVTITLPITLAIISALLFEVRGRLFAIPLAVVQEALRMPTQAVRTVDGREVITLRGTTLPLCRLADLFQLGPIGPAASEHYVIVVSVGNKRLGLCVERLSGQQDIVIKGLGRSLSGIAGISGATDLGDQHLVLVLDAASIIEEVLLPRGQLLAGEPMTQPDNMQQAHHNEPVEETGVREFLAFSVASESYALPLSCIREIMRVPSVTPVPRSPRDVLGIISVRGQVTTLIDLRQRLRVQVAPVSSRTRVLLVDQGDEIMGLLCDRVQQVHRLNEKEVEMASVLGADAASYVMGIGRPGQRKPEAQRGAKHKRGAGKSEGAENAAILILLDPIALLKRQVNHV